MEIVVTGRHTQVKQKFRDVVESKMNRVTAIAPDAQRAQIVLTHEGNPRQADTAKRVEITVIAGSTVVRAEASSTDEFSALDMALDKLTLRLRRTRDRRKDHRRGYINPTPVDLGAVAPPEPEEEPEPEEPNNSPEAVVAFDLGPGESVEVQVGDTPIVIRRKLHIAEPMSIDEALYEMELIGHDFFLFVNKETGRPSVVYHRHGWSYGVFEDRHPGEHQEQVSVPPRDTWPARHIQAGHICVSAHDETSIDGRVQRVGTAKIRVFAYHGWSLCLMSGIRLCSLTYESLNRERMW